MNLAEDIDAALDRAERGDLKAEEFYSALATSDPAMFTFLFDPDTRLLLEPEHDYLLFLAMVLLEALAHSGLKQSSVEMDLLESLAEENWGYLEYTSIENLTSTLSDHIAVDAYTFLEDACTPDTDHEVLSEAAVELVYVKCKTLIDSLAIQQQ